MKKLKLKELCQQLNIMMNKLTIIVNYAMKLNNFMLLWQDPDKD